MAVAVSVLLLSISGTIWSWGLERGFALWRCVLCVRVSFIMYLMYQPINISLRRSWERVVEEYLYAQTAWSLKNR